MKKLIVVADWVNDSLAVAEFRTAVKGFLKSPDAGDISFIYSVNSTVHTGFLLSQITETEERLGDPLKTVVFQSTNPRTSTEGGYETFDNAPFLVIRLKTGLYVCGPNCGYDFSFIKMKIDETFNYQFGQTVIQIGQFHSRDLYSRICAHLMDEIEEELGLEEISSNAIPQLSDYLIIHIDSFGNIKTNIRLDDFKGKYEMNDYLIIKVNNSQRKVKFSQCLQSGSSEELLIYPGSSGPAANPYLEIGNWKKSGASFFNNPLIGQKIECLVC